MLLQFIVNDQETQNQRKIIKKKIIYNFIYTERFQGQKSRLLLI